MNQEHTKKELIMMNRLLINELIETDNKINISQNTKVKLNIIKEKHDFKNYEDTIKYLLEVKEVLK